MGRDIFVLFLLSGLLCATSALVIDPHKPLISRGLNYHDDSSEPFNQDTPSIPFNNTLNPTPNLTDTYQFSTTFHGSPLPPLTVLFSCIDILTQLAQRSPHPPNAYFPSSAYTSTSLTFNFAAKSRLRFTFEAVFGFLLYVGHLTLNDRNFRECEIVMHEKGVGGVLGTLTITLGGNGNGNGGGVGGSDAGNSSSGFTNGTTGVGGVLGASVSPPLTARSVNEGGSNTISTTLSADRLRLLLHYEEASLLALPAFYTILCAIQKLALEDLQRKLVHFVSCNPEPPPSPRYCVDFRRREDGGEPELKLVHVVIALRVAAEMLMDQREWRLWNAIVLVGDKPAGAGLMFADFEDGGGGGREGVSWL